MTTLPMPTGITVQSVLDMINTLLEWEPAVMIIGITMASWAVYMLFNMLTHIGVNPLAGLQSDAQRGRALRLQRMAQADDAADAYYWKESGMTRTKGPVDVEDDEEDEEGYSI